MNYDAIVIGGSFAGLSAAMQIARALRPVCVIDAKSPRNRFATASHGFFGQDGARPADMIRQAREKLCAYPSVTVVAGEAASARAVEGGYDVELASGDRLSARKLVLAYGVSDVLPDLPGISVRWGKSVLHCPYCHGYEFAGKRLGVLNLRPGSLHQAQLIADWGPTTFFLNGHNNLNRSAHDKLQARGIGIEPAPVTGLLGEAPDLIGLQLADGRIVEIEALYIAPDTRMNSPIADQLGCAMHDGPFGPVVQTDEWKLTTVPGVFAAGDIARAPHNATWASADGVTAGAALHRSLLFDAAG
jgi:thioredoxin reductase